MPKAKKKLLPKDFEALLKAGDLTALKAVFDICEIDARGGYSRQTALAFADCSDELARWLVERGADLEARDKFGTTPLLARCGLRFARVGVLLELGADTEAADSSGNTPLHRAAAAGNMETVRALLQHGARVDRHNFFELTPLEWALKQCTNIHIAGLPPIAELLLAAAPAPTTGLRGLVGRLIGGPAEQRIAVTAEMKASVQRIGTEFEFHRPAFAADFLPQTEAGLERLYRLFGVPPVPRRLVHDRTSPIVAKAEAWEDRHQELWELLVPSNGAASTVQGEVIRISGKIHAELEHNGGGNWDADFRKMANVLPSHLGGGTPLPAPALEEALGLVREITRRNGAPRRLCELATAWVELNPDPIALPPPTYRR